MLQTPQDTSEQTSSTDPASQDTGTASPDAADNTSNGADSGNDPVMNPDGGLDFQDIQAELTRLWAQVKDQVLDVTFIWQVAAIAISAVLGYMLTRSLRQTFRDKGQEETESVLLRRAWFAVSNLMWPVVSAIFLWLAYGGFILLDWPRGALRIASGLLVAWILIRLITSIMKRGPLAQTVAVVAWVAAALYILKWHGAVLDWLSSVEFGLGDTKLSLLRILTSIVLALAALWVGRLAGDVVQARLKSTRALAPSMAGLMGQVAKIALMVIAVLVALQFVGFNLATLAVFSGAIGLGIGFGLQSIFSNFISGIIILLEKSVKVGDFIELQSGVTGLVREINIRSTLVTTNDNVDILVPNEEFIKAQVINWTLRESQRRLRVGFGVAYGTDKDIVKKAALEAADEIEWTEKNNESRAPQVWLVEFGDSSINYELVVWLSEDAVRRPARVKADYNWAIHSALERYDIEIPFPQRDLNWRTETPIKVQLESNDKAKRPVKKSKATAKAKDEG